MAANGFDKAKIPQYRRTLYLVVAVIVGIPLIVAINGMLNPQPPETPAQAEAREKEYKRLIAEQAEQDARDKQMSAHKDELCQIKLVCRQYYSARQECAVAGNFDNCVQIKIGNKDTSFCTNDGGVNEPQYVSDMPNEVECAARNAVHWLK
jgi:hypothetical protein